MLVFITWVIFATIAVVVVDRLFYGNWIWVAFIVHNRRKKKEETR